MSPPADPSAAAAVLLVDVDEALAALCAEWLEAGGWRVVRDDDAACAVALVDIAYPRQDGVERVQRITAAHPGTPVVVICPTCHPRVVECGSAARELGVAAVVAAPVRREALLGAISAAISAANSAAIAGRR